MTPLICAYIAIALIWSIAVYVDYSKAFPGHRASNVWSSAWYAALWCPIIVIAVIAVAADWLAAARRVSRRDD